MQKNSFSQKKGFALSLIFKVRVLELRNVLFNKDNKIIYHINANEIPGELSHKNLIYSHMKITCYLHMRKYHCCYGYIINHAFHTKKLLK